MQKKQGFIANRRISQKALTALVVILIAGLGTYLLTNSHAAAPYASIAATNGNLSTGASAQNCSGSSSSNSNCVVFGGSTDSNGGSPWIGLNGFTGWGPDVTSYIKNTGFRWARIDETSGGYSSNLSSQNAFCTLPDGALADEVNCALSDGLNALVIVPENAAQAMSWMQAYAAYGDRVVYEFGNEPFYNGVSASTYASEYQQTYNDKVAAGLTSQPLLFMTTGDPQNVYGSNTWLDEALAAVPNLRVDAFSVHPYGEANTNTNNNSNGVDGLLYLHQEAVSKGFSNTPWYVTEFGFTLCEPVAANECDTSSNTAYSWYVPSYCEQEKQLILSYNQMMPYGDGSSGTWLKGIMYYEVHDDSTGDFGLVTDPTTSATDNAGEAIGQEPSGGSPTPVKPRPSYSALAGYLTADSESVPTCSD